MTEQSATIGAVDPAAIPKAYYDLGSYVGPERMLTFWHQLKEVLALTPASLLEVGVGSRIVAGALREIGVAVETADVNPLLSPTYLTRVQELSAGVGGRSYDVVLCARVLHHVAFAEFDAALSQLAKVSGNAVVLTLPVDDFRLYFGVRITSRTMWRTSIGLPLWTKRMLLGLRPGRDAYYRSLWKIGSSNDTSLPAIERVISRHFRIEKSYAVPEDHSHHVFVLRKLPGAKASE